MQDTVRHSITEAITAYEEKPRELWIFDFPAQVSLTSSQIWWTTDVGIAFSRLEEGYETALKDFHKKQVFYRSSILRFKGAWRGKLHSFIPHSRSVFCTPGTVLGRCLAMSCLTFYFLPLCYSSGFLHGFEKYPSCPWSPKTRIPHSLLDLCLFLSFPVRLHLSWSCVY